MTLTNVSVVLNYEEYHMLIEALIDKRYTIQSRLDEVKEIADPYMINAGGDMINMIEEYEKDLTVLADLENKIEMASRPGGME